MMSDESPVEGEPTAVPAPATPGSDVDEHSSKDYFDEESPTSKDGADDDDDDDDVDDKLSQLPHPDELPRDTSHKQESLRRRKKKACLYAVGLIVLCAVAVVTAGVVKRFVLPNMAGSKEEEEVRPVESWTPAPGYYDDDATFERTPAPLDDDASRLVDARTFLIKRGISHFADLDSMGSPQRLAMEWICTADAMRLPVPRIEKLDPKFVQRYSVAVLYYALGGPAKWKTSLNFLKGDSYECGWNESRDTKNVGLVKMGVGCDDPTAGDGNGWRRVTRIWIPHNHGLEGSIPPEIRHLTRLNSLSLSHGKISGTIPDALCDLTQLEELGLSNNNIQGSLPSTLGQLIYLRVLALDSNYLKGSLRVLNDIPSLKYAYLQNNIFRRFGRDVIDPSGNSIDNDFLDVPRSELIHLDVSTNALEGNVPSRLLNHPTLTALNLHENSLTGPLRVADPAGSASTKTPPPPPLEYLNLRWNLLNGTIPSDLLGDWSSLTYLDLSHNAFKADFSDVKLGQAIGNMTDLKHLHLGYNPYSAQEFPSFLSIYSKPDLLELGLGGSNLMHTLPPWINMMKKLTYLDLAHNQLDGKINNNLGELTQLQVLLLNDNEFTGTVPTWSSLGAEWTALKLLRLDNNVGISGNLDESVCPGLSDDAEVVAFECPQPPQRRLVESGGGIGGSVNGTDKVVNGTNDADGVYPTSGADDTNDTGSNGTNADSSDGGINGTVADDAGGDDGAAAPVPVAMIQCDCCSTCCEEDGKPCVDEEGSPSITPESSGSGSGSGRTYERYIFKFEEVE
uniref:L domain-like protein n=1 Tax=Odontella aurita TaxID=265563 RepID=A0A7S4IZ13_9STRA|mmetsp:Transcript_33558/g.100019  ORF Transcript_33558/g.100019 Transcript_33558/m.100019 type:complete len:791 (+) Transcript_33558:226-2598(+)